MTHHPGIVHSLLLLLVWVLVAAGIGFCERAARRRIREWARERGYRLHGEQWLLFGGPSWMRSGLTYWVIVDDTNNRLPRCAWVGVADPFGLFGKKVQVQWAESSLPHRK